MTRKILVLPAGGSAERLLGLPKFMLPVNASQTIIRAHVESAIKAGFDEIHIGIRSKYFDLLVDHLKDFSNVVVVHDIEIETKTMGETLLRIFPNINLQKSDFISIALPDTVYLGVEMGTVYKSLFNCEDTLSLTTFSIRTSQFGKLGQVDIGADGKVIDIKDKTLGCPYPQIWGIASFKTEYVQEILETDAHIGITFERLLNSGKEISSVESNAKYFDCGTLSEYREFLNEIVI